VKQEDFCFMSLKKAGYLPRVIDSKLKEYLNIFGAISVEGPKWCGKTWASLNHANSVNYIMDPSGGYGNRERARLDPALALEGDKPRLIDEWQEVPGIWDAVRFDIDQEQKKGKYILTGSITPPRETYSHSGTGRFAIIRMRPMSLFESGDSLAIVSFNSLLNGEPIKPFSADIDLKELINLAIRGGWPETLNIPPETAGRVSEEYIRLISKNELFREDDKKRNTTKLSKLLRTLARNNATSVSLSTLSGDSDTQQAHFENEINLARQTTADYLADLKRIFVIEDIFGWTPDIRSKTRIRMSPKIIFADPSLAIAALGLNMQRLLSDPKTFGFMFENLCLRDILVYAENIGGTVLHYRDNSGLEVDAIVEMPDGAWSAFEIKLGEHQVEDAATTLCRLRDKMVSSGAAQPKCLCVITGGGFGRKRDDGVYVVPINALKP
jgi:predicted AAA+ superfamily ATPase